MSDMQDIVFTAPEYQQDQSLKDIQYRFTGSFDTGWTIERAGSVYLQLGLGYIPLKTLACGICSTDLVRYKLPFPLPQITGHEITAEFQQRPAVIEINASHLARGVSHDDCIYCRNNLASHCPERMTLGIDRLPGGFSPWILAPVNAIHILPEGVSPQAGVLVEPFAAALRAVELSPPKSNDRVAVLGPRRLGMLIIAALDSYRKLHNLKFEIVAVMRHQSLQQTAKTLGADSIVSIRQGVDVSLSKQFDIVYDTTGTPAGFELAAEMSRRTLHIKSTHGQPVAGLESVTAMVINEQTMMGLSKQNLALVLENSLDWKAKKRVYISPSLRVNKILKQIPSEYEIISDIDDAIIDQQIEFALVSSIDDVNLLTRPYSVQGQSLLRAGGTILLSPDDYSGSSSLLLRISKGQLELTTSRCGSFSLAIRALQDQPQLAEQLKENLVTQEFPLSELSAAMQLAAQSDKSIKVVVNANT